MQTNLRLDILVSTTIFKLTFESTQNMRALSI
jgi:hypothetical protein